MFIILILGNERIHPWGRLQRLQGLQLCLASLKPAAKAHGVCVFPPKTRFAQKWGPRVAVQKVKSWERKPNRFWGYAMSSTIRKISGIPKNHWFHWPEKWTGWRVESRGFPSFEQAYTATLGHQLMLPPDTRVTQKMTSGPNPPRHFMLVKRNIPVWP